MTLFRKFKFLSSLLAVGALFSVGTTSAQAPPNIVIFYADDVGIGDITAYRNRGGTTTLSSTPNVDALANEGMIFTDAHSAAGLCAPSRYSLLTGNLPARGRFFTGQFQAQGSFQVLPGQRTIANILEDANYNTGYVGKVHLGGGFSTSDGSPYRSQDFRTANERNPGFQFVDWMRGLRSSVNDLGFDYSFISHDGIQSTPYIYFENNRPISRLRFGGGRWRWQQANTNRAVVFDDDFVENRLLGGEIQEPDTGRNNVVGWPYWDSSKTGEVYTQAAVNFIRRHQRNGAGRPFYLQFASQAVHIPHTPGERFFGQRVAGVEETPHLDMIREMDLQVGRIVSELRRNGLLNNTIFVFTSDNGGLRFSSSVGHETSGIYNSRKGSILEGGHRVPFIVRWAGPRGRNITPRRSQCDLPISQMDLFATFADLLETPQGRDQGLDSTSILPYFFGDFDTALRRALFVSAQSSYAVRFRNGLKAIGSVNPPTARESEDRGQIVNLVTPNRLNMIFDLRNDISETRNLRRTISAERQEQILDFMRRRIEASDLNPRGRSTRPQDSDGDGLFDYWERRGSGTLNDFDERIFRNNSDRDGDGITDAEEYFMRTDATTPN